MRNFCITTILPIIIVLLTHSCSKDPKPRDFHLIAEGNGVTDADNNQYKTVIIGNQEWMAENLRTTTYCNGDSIKGIRDSTDMIDKEPGEALWFTYNYNNENEQIFGKLYTWYVIDNEKGICPCGWEIPTMKDWNLLVNNLIQFYKIPIQSAGLKLKSGALENNSGYWTTDIDFDYEFNPEDIGDNETNFSALPGGYLDDQQFFKLNEVATFWSADEVDALNAVYSELSNISPSLQFNLGSSKDNGFSIRCIKRF